MAWLKKLTIEVVHGDLLSLDVEALVCNVNTGMELNYRLGRQLQARCGSPFAQAVRGIAARFPNQRLPLGGAVAVPLPAPLGPIRLVVFCGWWDADNDYTANLIYGCVINSLRQAFEHRVKSVAFPLLGTGSGLVSARELGAVVVRAFRELNALKNSDSFPVEEVIFCSDRESALAELREILNKAGM